MKSNKKLTINDCKRAANKRNGFCLSKQYLNSRLNLYWQCVLGHRWYSNLDNIKNKNSWCPYCANNISLSINDCKKRALKNNGKCLSTIYENIFSKLKWQCGKGHIWVTTFAKIRQGQWCRICANETKKRTINDCYKQAQYNNGNCLSSTYINNQTKMLWRCSKNHIWEASFNSVQSGRWCPECNIFKSQRELKKIIIHLLNTQVISNYRKFNWLKNKNNMEIDLWCPKLKLAIEYDGKQHFKPVRFHGVTKKQAIINFKKQIKRDKLKTILIENHPNEIKYFIRFNYMDTINKISVKNKLLKYFKI